MSKLLKLLPALLVLVLITSCGAKPLPPLSYSANIVAFGDSLTAGYGTSIEKSYPAVLTELSNRTVINAGISGETTSQGMARFESVLNEHSPELVILIEGGNDILRNHSHSETKKNLASMIHFAKASKINIVLLGVPEKNLFSDAAPFYAELAAEHDLVFDKSLLSSLLRSPSLKSDTIHLNAKGYRKMAEEIHQILKDNGAL